MNSQQWQDRIKLQAYKYKTDSRMKLQALQGKSPLYHEFATITRQIQDWIYWSYHYIMNSQQWQDRMKLQAVKKKSPLLDQSFKPKEKDNVESKKYMLTITTANSYQEVS